MAGRLIDRSFNKAINWDKLKDPKVLKELEKVFNEEEELNDSEI
jgi:hypothetical protein